MLKSFGVVGSVAAAAWLACQTVPVHAQESPFNGVWSMNRTTSEMPRDIGFAPSWLTQPGESGRGSGDTSGGRSGRGGRGGGGSGRSAAPAAAARPENFEDARRTKVLIDEARNPAARLIIIDTPAAFTMTNELGQSRTVHPDGKEESVQIDGVAIPTTTRRDGDRVVVAYRVTADREVRYTYAASSNPPQLVVELQFFDRGPGDKARRMYDPGLASSTARTATPPPAPAPGLPPGVPAAPPLRGLTPPAARPQLPEPIDQRPGAELRGLKDVGIMVEELGPQATTCGLTRDALQGALTKALSAGGFTVRRNSDEATYLYVNVMTSQSSGAACVSRYDATLYTHATTTLPYRESPVLVQVSLLHRGGLGSSGPAGHGAAVTHALEEIVNGFVTQIQAANKN